MVFLKILISAFVGTFMMTAFSYLISYLSSHNFKEPELLNLLTSKEKRIPFKVKKKSIFGFIIHYLIGCLFVVCFYLFLEFTGFSYSLITGSGLGFIAGLTGVLGWKIAFKLHKNPVDIPLTKFFIQLVIAHIIFGFHVALVYLHWPI